MTVRPALLVESCSRSRPRSRSRSRRSRCAVAASVSASVAASAAASVSESGTGTGLSREPEGAPSSRSSIPAFLSGTSDSASIAVKRRHAVRPGPARPFPPRRGARRTSRPTVSDQPARGVLTGAHVPLRSLGLLARRARAPRVLLRPAALRRRVRLSGARERLREPQLCTPGMRHRRRLRGRRPVCRVGLRSVRDVLCPGLRLSEQHVLLRQPVARVHLVRRLLRRGRALPLSRVEGRRSSGRRPTATQIDDLAGPTHTIV